MSQQPPEKEQKQVPSPPVRVTRIEPIGEVVVEHHPVPPKGPPDKTIHPRRPLPPIPEKRPAADKDKDEEAE